MRNLCRSLGAASLFIVIATGCTDQLNSADNAKSPEEVRQLAAVTDSVVTLVRSISGDGVLSSEFQANAQQVVAALAATEAQLERHRDALLNVGTADVVSCVRSHSIELADIDTHIQRLNTAVADKDEKAVERRKIILMRLAQDASLCAALAKSHFVNIKRLEDGDFDDSAVVLSEIFAVATAFRAAAGLSVEHLLKDQISAYETIARRLGPKRESQVVTDALPKLKSIVPPSGPA